MFSSTALMAASMAMSAIGTGIGVAGSIQQSQRQASQQEYQGKMARYQADIQRQNQKLAEEQASAERKAGYENMSAERLKTARLIGQQRAIAGASGVAVDMGSFEDVAEDTAGRGEIDAVNAYNRGIDSGYNAEIQAWNYGSSAAGLDAQASAYESAASQTRSGGIMSAIGQGIGGIADMGTTWAKFSNPEPKSPAKSNWLERAGDYAARNARRF